MCVGQASTGMVCFDRKTDLCISNARVSEGVEAYTTAAISSTGELKRKQKDKWHSQAYHMSFENGLLLNSGLTISPFMCLSFCHCGCTRENLLDGPNTNQMLLYSSCYLYFEVHQTLCLMAIVAVVETCFVGTEIKSQKRGRAKVDILNRCFVISFLSFSGKFMLRKCSQVRHRGQNDTFNFFEV